MTAIAAWRCGATSSSRSPPLDGRVIATDKETGKPVWDKNLHDQPDLELTAAPLALKDHIIIGASGGDRGVRDWVVALDARTGKLQWKTYSVPAPGEPGQRDLEGQEQRLADRRRRLLRHRLLRSRRQSHLLGLRKSGARLRSVLPPRRQSLHVERARLRRRHRQDRWYHQYTPNDSHDYDETGTHIIIDTKVNGEDRKILSHAGRNGFHYVFDRINGQFLRATQYRQAADVDQGHRPEDRQAARIRSRQGPPSLRGARRHAPGPRAQPLPATSGGSNHWPASYSHSTGLLYIPSIEGCADDHHGPRTHVKGNFDGGVTGENGRSPVGVVMLDPRTSEFK